MTDRYEVIMFIEIPASKRSMAMRKKVLGVGVNDANYIISIVIDGARMDCQIYGRWINMLKRCYCKKYQERKPTYVGCSVCDEWLLFSNFKKWMESQDHKGKHLDKDLLINGNKIYSPEACMFVSPEINSLFTDSAATRGEFPIGVRKVRKSGRFASRCKMEGVTVSLGTFATVEAASNAYKEFKSKAITKAAEQQSEPLRSALLSRVYI